MFEIIDNKTAISALKKKTFSELNLKEVSNLQEWIAKDPNCLGEELLIFQKEFAGFDETRERLDLLALDKNGSLVIIENKRDNTDKDVVWQAIKYTSYCSTLTTSQIIDIFQSYLDSQVENEEARDKISEFLDGKNIDEVILNEGSSQRIILVAADFRKEVTSTVLWLISKGLDAKCIKVTPYSSLDKKLFLDIRQIIPTKEAEDYMIGMSSKSKEETRTKTVINKRKQLRERFWDKMLEEFKKKNFALYENVSASGGNTNWLNASSGVSGCAYQVIFGKKEARTDIYIGSASASKEQNEKLFKYLENNKSDIEKTFEKGLTWEPLNEKKACRIKFAEDFDGYNEENWPEMIDWIYKNMSRLEQVFKPVLVKYKG